jgi:hypothetical protein
VSSEKQSEITGYDSNIVCIIEVNHKGQIVAYSSEMTELQKSSVFWDIMLYTLLKVTRFWRDMLPSSSGLKNNRTQKPARRR